MMLNNLMKKRGDSTHSLKAILKIEKEDKREKDICFMMESPFRVLKLAERGSPEEFKLIADCEPERLNVVDGQGRTAAHLAAFNDHIAILRLIASAGVDLNLLDSRKNNPLHLAVEGDALDAIRFLLERKVNPNQLNTNLHNPVHLACVYNKPECLRVMAEFEHLIDVHQGAEHGRTPLHLACIFDHEECVKILLEDFHASPRKTCIHHFYPIHEAAKHGASRSLGALLTLGAINGCQREEMILFQDSEGNVALHSAVHGGDIQAVKLCLLSGGRISTQQQDLFTAVHLACSQGALEIVKLMFTIQPEEKDAALGAYDMERMTPLHRAAMYDHEELVEYLITEGASLNVLDKNRNSPLHLAALRRSWKAAKVLLQHGANPVIEDDCGRIFVHILIKQNGIFQNVIDDSQSVYFLNINAKDKNGITPLHLAGKYGNFNGFCDLITHGANLASQNVLGENVFHVACRHGTVEIVKNILNMENSNGVVNEGNGNGLTPLHIAANYGHSEIVKLLMAKGALLHRDYDGCTPLHLAAKNGFTRVMKLILTSHSHLIDMVDDVGNTPLHVAAKYDQSAAVSLLLKRNCALKYNHYGYSAIDYALQKNYQDVVLTMVTDENRKDHILSLTYGKHPHVMAALIAKMPAVAKAVLDNNVISCNEQRDSKSFKVKFDFKWFSVPDTEHLTESELEPLLKFKRKKRSPFPPEKIYLPVLNEMVAYKREELLSHELSQKYLEMKWNAYGKHFQLLTLFLYLVYLALVTCYAVSPWTKDLKFFTVWKKLHGIVTNEQEERKVQDLFASNETIIPLAPTQEVSLTEVEFFNYLRYYYHSLNFENVEDLFNFAVGFNQLAKVILCVSSVILALEIISLFRHGLKQCLVLDTWIWYGVNLANLTMSSIQWFSGREFVNPCAALAAFLSWFYLLLILQRFDLVGIYVSMFLEILRTLCRVLLIFSVLIIAFGLSFYVLLSNGNHLVFNDIPFSIMRTFSMMLGDLDFMNTFGFPHHCQLMELMNMTKVRVYKTLPECKSPRRIPYPLMSFVMVALYMIFNCILLVNLLIGLAVGDIDSVKRNAQLKRLAMQVTMLTNLEKTIPNFCLHRLEKPFIEEFPNNQEKQANLMEKIGEFFNPKQPPLDDTRESFPQAVSVVSSIESSTETLEKLATDMELVMSWMNSTTASLQKISTTLNIQEDAEINSKMFLSTKSRPDRRVKSPKKFVRKTTHSTLCNYQNQSDSD